MADRVHRPRAAPTAGGEYPALFALTVQVIGSVNATALVFVGIAPLAVGRRTRSGCSREVKLQAGAGDGRADRCADARGKPRGGSPGLWAQGSYGLDILKYTETLKAVSRTSLPNEVLRGLGYWFFYGRDKLGLVDRGEPELHAVAHADPDQLRDPGRSR